MPDSGKNGFDQVFHWETQSRGVDAGMTGDVRILKQRFVHQQGYTSFVVVHQSHDTD